MISEASATVIQEALQRARAFGSHPPAVDVAAEEIAALLALYAEAENVDPDSLTDDQKKDVIREALYRVLPQYRIASVNIERTDHGDHGAETFVVVATWDMT